MTLTRPMPGPSAWLRLCAAAALLAMAGSAARATEAAAPQPTPAAPLELKPTQAPAAAATPPVASAPQVTQSGDVTRLSFEVTAKVDVRAFVLANPARVIMDLPEVLFDVEAAPAAEKPRRPLRRARGKSRGEAGKLIASYRYGRLGQGRSRIVVDLAQPARIVRAETVEGPDGRRLLALDLARSDRAAFAAAAAQALASGAGVAANRAAEASAPARKAGDSRPVIVIDPGHGGVDVGAAGPDSTFEKDIVFEFSRALARQLESNGRFAVVLTRSEDVFVPLAERVRIARKADAQLFISIHADTLSEGGVSGATVYTVSDRASDAHAAKLAEKENFADKLAGYEAAEDSGEITDILFDLTRRETRAYSHVFARTLVSVWKDAARLNKNPHRSAGFLVLKAPDVPSVLLELGYLSSQKDAALLLTPAWREKTAGAVARSIDQFFGLRTPAQPAQAAPESGVAAALSE